MNLNTLDLVILIGISFSGLFGLFRGFTASVLSLLTWVVALWLPLRFTPEFSLFLPDSVESPAARSAIAAATLFFSVFIMLSIIGWMLRKLLGLTGLGFVDRLFGGVLGLIRGVIIVAVLAMFASANSDFPKEKWWGESLLMEDYVLEVSDFIRNRLPENLSSKLSLNRLDPVK